MNKVDRFLAAAVPSDEVLSAARAQMFLRDWEAIVGETLARKSRPDRYAKGVVWVAVEGSAWATELRMRKGEILARLTEASGNQYLFKDVRFGVRALPNLSANNQTTPMAEPHDENVKQDEDVHEKNPRELSIREIAERRLKKWKPST